MASLRSSTSTFYLVYVVFIATIGPLQFGYHLVRLLSSLLTVTDFSQGELNAPQKVITCEVDRIPTASAASFPRCIQMNPSQWGLVQSIFTVGGFLGALAGGPMATRYGRLFAMRLTTVFFVLGPLAQALASDISVMCVGRFLSGIGAGASTVICPLYIAEISPLEKRGLFGAFTQVMINLGILTSQLLGYFLSRGNLWRIIFGIAGLIGALELLGLFFAPESPKWLAENGHPVQARRVLQRIRGTHADIDAEIKDWDMRSDPEEQPLLTAPAPSANVPTPEPSVSLIEAIRLAKYRRAVIAVVAAMFAQQATGINSVVMYSVAILGAIIPSAAALITVLVSALNVVITTICAPLADKIGRKTCLLLSIGGMGTNSLLLAIGLSYDVAALSVVATLLFVASFGVGLGPVPFILASEIVGPEAVGATQSWGLAACWIATFCVAQFFPVLNAALPKGHVFWVFAAIALAVGLFIAWWVPESKGKATAAEVWGDDEAD